jgi:hypothetical protein
MMMKQSSVGAYVLLIALAIILSNVVVIAETENQFLDVYNSLNNDFTVEQNGPVVWDNGMNQSGLIHTQWDEAKQFDFYAADDFKFEEDTEVVDVHWIGGYWGEGYETGDFDWYISFYYENSTLEEPEGHPKSPSLIGPFQFLWSEISKEFIGDTGNSVYYSLSVDLPEVIIFEANIKYWISIWAEGIYPPQAGWGYHKSFILISAVLASDYFGFPFWTPGSIVQGYDFDMAFQLTEPLEPLPPTPPDIDGPREGAKNVNICWTFHSEDPNNDYIRYLIDWGDGKIFESVYNESCTPIEFCHTYEKKGLYIITAIAEDETGLKSNESTFGVTIPRTRASSFLWFDWLLERSPFLERLLTFLLL